MAPVDRRQPNNHHGKGFLCALPPLPLPLPLPKQLRDDGLVSSLTHLHTLLSNVLDHCKHSLEQALDRNPLPFRLLPPQLLPSRPRQVKDANRRHPLAAYNFAAAFPSDSVAAMVASNGVLNFLNIYNTLLIVRLILTWFPDPPRVILNPLSTICDPYLNIFRGIIPPLGGTIDLSPILAFFVLNVFTNTAAALPADLSSGQKAGLDTPFVSSISSFGMLTSSQKAWLKRQVAAADMRKS